MCRLARFRAGTSTFQRRSYCDTSAKGRAGVNNGGEYLSRHVACLNQADLQWSRVRNGRNEEKTGPDREQGATARGGSGCHGARSTLEGFQRRAAKLVGQSLASK